ncbi:uncharacterized protein LOC133185631 [Saccostrea echinata]|uniref:uncharacterized protein LOC133185631 n=1 Tax=Saccostrea echinata TaxID=191078 RepID=UPI002A80B194|nr:uncharacterized protein LOC133185631 [Saccostrea echinata]
MLSRILQFCLLPFLICLGSKLNQRDPNIFQEDPVLDVLNPTEIPDGQTITTQQLRTILTAFQKDNVARITKLQNDFKVTVKYQENRINSLEKKIAEQERIISILQHDFPAVRSNEEPLNSNALEKEESWNGSDESTGKTIVTDVSSIDDKLSHTENKNLRSLTSKRHNKVGRKERLLIPEVPGEVVAFYAYMSANLPSNVATPHHVLIFDNVKTNIERLLIPEVPGAVVAFYAYMSTNLPSNVATPHHVLIFDHVRTNIGSGYHPSTGVFIAPETGVYVFISSFRNGDGGIHSTQLMINSEEWGITHSRTPSNSFLQSTGCVVAHVNKGDDVFGKTSDTSSGLITSDIYGKTSFSGWKID